VFLQVASSYDVVSLKIFDSTNCTGPTREHWRYPIGACATHLLVPKFTCQYGSPYITLESCCHCGQYGSPNGTTSYEQVISGQCILNPAGGSVLYAKEASLDSYVVRVTHREADGRESDIYYSSGSCQQHSATSSNKYREDLQGTAIVSSYYETSGDCTGTPNATQSITNGAAFGAQISLIEALPATTINACAAPDITPGSSANCSQGSSEDFVCNAIAGCTWIQMYPGAPGHLGTCVPSSGGPSTFSCQAIKNAYSAQQCCTNPNAIFTLPAAAGSRRAEEPKADSKDVVSKMETLSKLHKQGFLINEEFQAQRVRLLDKLLR